MKHKASIWLLAAAALVILGLGLLAWSVHEDATALGGALVTNTYEIKETYTGIRACTSADIRLEPTDGQDTTVICQEKQDRLHTVRVEDGVLTILEQEPRHDRRLVQIQFKTPIVTIRLPRGDYDALSIEGDVGDVNVPQGLRFETAAITASTGDVDFSASVQQTLAVHLSTGEIRLDGIGAGELELETSTGDIRLTNTGCRGKLTLRVSTGEAVLEHVSCQALLTTGSTGDLRLTDVAAEQTLAAKRSTGEIRLEDCDAGALELETSTGDITGSLRTEKIIFAQSGTGEVSVPKSTEGGRCDVRSDTGDIRLTIRR